jgi:molybdate transport repressor ModE-like protein
MSGILWDDVRYLEAVERTGSVGGAARELGLSASTVYRRVAALEASAGQSCLVRGPGEAMLTDFGAALARVGRQTRKALAEAEGAARARDTGVSGEVSLTTVESLLPFLVGPIAALTAAYPLRVTLHLGDDGPSVRDREVDVAIGIMPRPPSGCWGRRLCALPCGVYGTPAAVARDPASWVVRAAAERHSPESAWEREHAAPVAAAAPFAALVSLVAGGVGLGLMPRLLAGRHPGLVEATAHRASVAGLTRTAWLLTHPDQRRNPRVVALMKALRQGFAGAT